MKIYLLPGLGADERMYEFQRTILPDAEFLPYTADWKGESITSYAQKMLRNIDVSQPYILIGTSLGGIIASEMAKISKPEKLILIATVKNRRELPAWIRSLKLVPVYKMLGGEFYKRLNKFITIDLFEKKKSKIADLVADMACKTDPAFIEWAVDAVIRWENNDAYEGDFLHIHGTKDLLFPVENIKNYVSVEGGTHLVNMVKHREVNRLILNYLEN